MLHNIPRSFTWNRRKTCNTFMTFHARLSIHWHSCTCTNDAQLGFGPSMRGCVMIGYPKVPKDLVYMTPCGFSVTVTKWFPAVTRALYLCKNMSYCILYIETVVCSSADTSDHRSAAWSADFLLQHTFASMGLQVFNARIWVWDNFFQQGHARHVAFWIAALGIPRLFIGRSKSNNGRKPLSADLMAVLKLEGQFLAFCQVSAFLWLRQNWNSGLNDGNIRRTFCSGSLF